MSDEARDDKPTARPSSPFRFKATRSPLKEERLAVGQAVSLAASGSDFQLLATIQKISEERLWLELAKPIPEVKVKPGDHLQLKLWDYYEAFYCDSVVMAVSGVQGESFEVSRPADGEIIERKRAWVVYEEILFALTVEAAVQKDLVGRRVEGLKTLKLEQMGFEFRTELPLKSRDRVEMKLLLPPDQELTALGEVVGSQEVEAEERKLHAVHMRFLEMDGPSYNKLALFLAQTVPAGTIDDIFWTG